MNNITYCCLECDQFTPYCLKCNDNMHRILESRFFKCYFCDCLHSVRYSKKINIKEEFNKFELISNCNLNKSNFFLTNEGINKSSIFIVNKENINQAKIDSIYLII